MIVFKKTHEALKDQLAEERESREKLLRVLREVQTQSEMKDQQLRDHEARIEMLEKEEERQSRHVKDLQGSLDTLQGNLARIAQDPTPFLHLGLLRIRMPDVQRYQGNDEGFLVSVNEIDLNKVGLRRPIKLTAFDGMVADYYNRDPESKSGT